VYKPSQFVYECEPGLLDITRVLLQTWRETGTYMIGTQIEVVSGVWRCRRLQGRAAF
jgi:hypothetical protein